MKYLFLLSTLLLFSCKKNTCGSCESTSQNYCNINAKIVWGGPMEVDGCDWLIEINNVLYHPASLSANFKHDQQNVILNYQVTNENFTCGLAPLKLPVINIISIK